MNLNYVTSFWEIYFIKIYSEFTFLLILYNYVNTWRFNCLKQKHTSCYYRQKNDLKCSGESNDNIHNC